MTLALLVLLHGDDPRMELTYFWSAILIVLLPIAIFGGLTYWLYRMWRRERKQH